MHCLISRESLHRKDCLIGSIESRFPCSLVVIPEVLAFLKPFQICTLLQYGLCSRPGSRIHVLLMSICAGICKIMRVSVNCAYFACTVHCVFCVSVCATACNVYICVYTCLCIFVCARAQDKIFRACTYFTVGMKGD